MLCNVNNFECFERKTAVFCKLSSLGMSTNQVGINLEKMTLKIRKGKRQKKKSIQKDDQKDHVSGKNQKHCK